MNGAGFLILLLFITGAYISYLLYTEFAPSKQVLPVTTRRDLRRKMYSTRQSPRLCCYHAQLTLRKGQIALLDEVNCDICGDPQPPAFKYKKHA